MIRGMHGRVKTSEKILRAGEAAGDMGNTIRYPRITLILCKGVAFYRYVCMYSGVCW